MIAKECNYFGLKHDEVTKRFEGSPTYVGDVCLASGQPVAVYRSASPNREKGHKDYLLLTNRYVSGMDQEEMAKHAIHNAVLCTGCNTILYSVHRHHFHMCECPNETFVDGGRDYLRMGGASINKIQIGTYDVLTKKWNQGEAETK